MGPGRDFGLPPGKQNVGMVPLLLGQFSDAIHKRQGRAKVRELVAADKMMFVLYAPLVSAGQHAIQVVEIFSLEWRDTAAAGNAIAISE